MKENIRKPLTDIRLDEFEMAAPISYVYRCFWCHLMNVDPLKVSL